MATEKAILVPPQAPTLYPVVLSGLTCADPMWLPIISSLTELKIPFTFLGTPDQGLLDSLKNFPVAFAILGKDQDDPAIIQSRCVIYSEGYAESTPLTVARTLGKKVVSTASLEGEDIQEKIQELVKPRTPNDLLEMIAKKLPKSRRQDFLCLGRAPQDKLRKLLIKFPTFGRPEKFYSTFDKYVTLLSGRNDVTFMVTIDTPDASMPFDEVAERLAVYENPESVRVIVKAGMSTGKIHAVNRDMEEAPEFDVLLLASDDMIPDCPGYDDKILQMMEKYFPSTDGVLWFNDGYTEKRLNTLCCLGRKYYDRFGYIYHPDYTSLWCDNEFMRVANRLGRQAYIDWTMIRHEHPMNDSSAPMDEFYDKSEKWYAQDEKVFQRRSLKDFGVEQQRVLLSVLIATMVKRRNLRQALVAKITQQIEDLNAQGLVEIVIDEDKGEKPIGTKRNDLVRKAKGEYCIFVDDDDDLADTFVESLMANLGEGDVDCVTFGGATINADGSSKTFIHSLMYPKYGEDDKAYYRTPNHINAIKSEIARRHPFPDKNFSEDHDFALSVLSDLKSEKFIPHIFYLYRPIAGGASSIPDPHNKGQASHTTGPVKSVDRPLGRRRSAARTRRTRRIT
jgi:hypothetical protein